MPSYDLFVYHDFDDTVNDRVLSVGEAGSLLGDRFDELEVVAVEAPIHSTKDATIVLAHRGTPPDELRAPFQAQPPAS